MIATTQTALLLAEMDGEMKEKNCDTEKYLNTTVNEPDLNATGFILPEDNGVNFVTFLVICFMNLEFFCNHLHFHSTH